jgi:hypothetical protein
LDEFIDDSRARQRNIVYALFWNDAFFWNGALHPSLVQTITAWILGLSFAAHASLLVVLAFPELQGADHSRFGFELFILIAVAFCLVGIRIFRNGFPRRPAASN